MVLAQFLIFLELRQLTAEPYARGLRPRNHTDSGDPEITVTKVLETEQVKKKHSKTKLHLLMKVGEVRLC